MDQTALLLMVVAALLAGKPPPLVETRGKIASCATVGGDMPPIADIKLTNPSLLLPDDERMLSRFAEFMRAKNCSVQIEGFTSGAKSRKNGDDRRRAETVRNYLTKDLVAKDQVKAEGKGEPPEKGLTPEQKKFARIVP